MPDFPNFQILGRFGSFHDLFWGFVLAGFGSFRLVSVRFGWFHGFWIILGFRNGMELGILFRK